MSTPLIQENIHEIRGQKVMLDRDLAVLYEVPVKSLNLAVKRNADRFPPDFMFRLTKEEYANLRFQNETSSLQWGDNPVYKILAFLAIPCGLCDTKSSVTEVTQGSQGIAMDAKKDWIDGRNVMQP